MDINVKIKKRDKTTSEEELQQLSKEELIARIRSLEAHNVQLQNIISKSGSSYTPHIDRKNFDFTRCRYRHILLQLCYFGWDNRGFAVQEDCTNTIENHLFYALTKTCLIKDRSSSNYHRCGRTDKGVSSFGQVISLDVRSKLSEENENDFNNEIDYCKMLNCVLPNNIQCIAWSPVNNNFSARFDCVGRTYKYYFPKGNLDTERMNEACKFLIGSHDFRNFAKMDVGNGVVQFIRNILDFRIEPLKGYSSNENEYSIYVAIIKGNAFLWHQIRYIMGILFLIGAKKESPEVVKELLDVKKNPRKPEYNMANEVPLNLFSCEYNDANWQTNQENLQTVGNKFQELWTFHTVKAVMIKDVIDDLIGKLGNSQMIKCPSESLVTGVKSKKYIPLMKRKKCDSLEDKIEHFAKRNRIEVVQNNDALNK